MVKLYSFISEALRSNKKKEIQEILESPDLEIYPHPEESDRPLRSEVGQMRGTYIVYVYEDGKQRPYRVLWSEISGATPTPTATPEPTVEPTPEPDLVEAKVFLVVGQSNAQGSAASTLQIPEGYFESEMDAVLVDRTEPGNSATIDNEFQLLPNSYIQSRFGPEVGLTKMIASSFPDDKIVIIHASSPGTGLFFWNAPGQTGHDTLMDRIDVVESWLNDLIQAEEIDTITYSGLITVNGENEANGNFPETWRTQFEQLVNVIRTKVQEPELPVFTVQLQSDLPQPPAGHVDTVRALQEQWAIDDPNGYLISSDGLFRMDNWHYGSISMLTLGERIGESWLNNVADIPVATIRLANTQNNRTDNNNVLYSITWNKPVTGFSISDVSEFNTSTGGNIEILNEIVTDTEYEVSVSNNTIPGTIDLVIDADTINGNARSFNDNTRVLHHNSASVGQLISYDGFGSTARASLSGLDSGVGWTSQGWITGTGNYPVINSPALTYGDLLTSQFFVRGGSSFQQACRILDLEKTYHFLNPEKAGANPGVFQQGTTLWISYLIRPISVGAIQRVSLSRGTTNTYNDGDNLVRIYQLNGTWHVGFRNIVNASGDDTGISLVSNETYFMCHKIVFGGPSGTNQVFTWINPDNSLLGGPDLDELTATTAHSNSSDNNFRLSRIKWYPGGGENDGDLGDIRIGTTFAAVSPSSIAYVEPTPEPTP